MKPFLAELSEQLYQQHKGNLQELTLVFPNRRAGLFFRKYLSQHIEKPVWAPEILSIDEFVKRLSNLQSADQLTLLFLLYDVYKKSGATQESFDQFYYWGEMLLRDFNDIDKYLVKAGDLFTDLKNQKDIEQLFDYLTGEQVEVIRRFWSSFNDKPSKHQEDFLKVWHVLEKVYVAFRERLEQEGLGYDGMIFREVAKKAQKEALVYSGRQLIFAGFNALTKAEEIIVASMIRNANAQMYWDLDAYYFGNKHQEAGYFLRKYAKHKVFGQTFPKAVSSNFLGIPKEITMVGVPLAVGQTKLLGEILKEDFDQPQQHVPEKTAIVLPDEQMLFPVLHALPEVFEDINITMGYPLRDTPLNGFLEHILNLQQNVQESASGKVSFYYVHVLSLLKHPYFSQYNSKHADDLIKKIERTNAIRIYKEEFGEDALYKAVFCPIKSAEAIFDYLLHILTLINLQIGGGEGMRMVTVEKEYIFHFYTQLKRLKEIVAEQQITFTMQTFLKLFRQVIYNLKLPFSGEPLNGLQVMGVLETRNLDFDNVYILSMNEGNFPPGISQSSFVPFNLRKGYGLPTYEQQDAIYAYSFYRLLQRAKKVVLFYNTESGLQTGGEMSRFLYQLQYEAPVKVKEHILSNPIKVPFPVPVVIPKDERILVVLEEYCLNGTGELKKALTPSAFNTYLDCRVKFYFRYVAKLYEPESIQEEIDAPTFGNLFHDMMEGFYTSLLEKEALITAKALEVPHLLEEALEKAFRKHYHLDNAEGLELEGRDIIVREIILKMGKQIVENDKDYAPFYVLGVESEGDAYRINLVIDTALGKKTVAVKGIIDRIDLKDGVVRVIDYKTGKDDKRFESIPSLFDRNNLKRNKAAMQTLIYSLIYAESGLSGDYIITPGLYNARELFNPGFDIHLSIRDEVTKKHEPVIDARNLHAPLKEEMAKMLEEIFDPSIPFDQTNNLRICEYCPYKGICHR